MWFHPEHRVATARYLSSRARDTAAGVSGLPMPALRSLSCLGLLHPCMLLPFPTSVGEGPRPQAAGLLCLSPSLKLLVLTGLGGLPTLARGSPECVLPPTPPSPFISAQFLLDGKALSLTDLQVRVAGVTGRR